MTVSVGITVGIVVAQAPRAAAAWRYLDRRRVDAPATVDVADNTLRCFSTIHRRRTPGPRRNADVRRPMSKVQAVLHRAHHRRRPATSGTRSGSEFEDAALVLRWDHRWDWTTHRNGSIFSVDVPVADDPLPQFLDDVSRPTRSRSAGAAPFDRLVIELLSRTGMRVGELCTLERGAVDQQGTLAADPGRQAHNDRLVNAPERCPVLIDWLADHPPVDRLLLHYPASRSADTGDVVRRIAAGAGLGPRASASTAPPS
ncbi:MAG: hypothetical protein U0Q03_20495 [Acidimicrobiales bacterium]